MSFDILRSLSMLRWDVGPIEEFTDGVRTDVHFASGGIAHVG